MQLSSEKPVVGWFCTYTPEELLLATGLESKRILGQAGSLAKADNYLHPNVCAYVRACFGSLVEVEEQQEKLSGVVGIDSCDAMRRLYDVCRFFLPLRFSHILALPHTSSQAAVGFFRSELKKFVVALHESFGREADDEQLHESIRLLNKTRRLLEELDALRRESSSLTGSKYYQILLHSMTQPKQTFNRMCEERVEQLRKENSAPPDGVKLVLAGGILDDTWIIDAIEAAGGHVVADDLCCGSRYFSGMVEPGDDPLQRLAERYIERPPCARMCAIEARIERLVEMVEESGAQGIIYHAVKFCDTHMLDWVMIHRELQRKGIPSLRCEADYSIGSREQIRTRVEAFLEMVR